MEMYCFVFMLFSSQILYKKQFTYCLGGKMKRWVLFYRKLLGHFHNIMQQKHIATHQRSTHPLQAGDIHFIATSPFTAQQALMFGGPVGLHPVFRWEAWLSEVPCLSLCVEQSLGIRTVCPCLCSFDKDMCPAPLYRHVAMGPRREPPMTNTVHQPFLVEGVTGVFGSKGLTYCESQITASSHEPLPLAHCP